MLKALSHLCTFRKVSLMNRYCEEGRGHIWGFLGHTKSYGIHRNPTIKVMCLYLAEGTTALKHLWPATLTLTVDNNSMAGVGGGTGSQAKKYLTCCHNKWSLGHMLSIGCKLPSPPPGVYYYTTFFKETHLRYKLFSLKYCPSPLVYLH